MRNLSQSAAETCHVTSIENRSNLARATRPNAALKAHPTLQAKDGASPGGSRELWMMVRSILDSAAIRFVETDKWAGSAGIPEASTVTPITINRREGGRLLVTDVPPAAAGQKPPCFPATGDPLGRASPDHVVYALIASEAAVNCEGLRTSKRGGAQSLRVS